VNVSSTHSFRTRTNRFEPTFVHDGNQSNNKVVGTSHNKSGDRFTPNRAGKNVDLSKNMLRTKSMDELEEEPVEADDSNVQNQLPNKQKVVPDANKEERASRFSATLVGVEDNANNHIISFQERASVSKGDTVNHLNILCSVSGTARSASMARETWVPPVHPAPASHGRHCLPLGLGSCIDCSQRRSVDC
jgi:hypothetical protein